MDHGDDLEDASSSTTSKHFSNVWEYFEIIPVGPDGIKRATCIQCTKVLSYEHGTSNIRRHIGKCLGLDLSNKADAPPPKRICLDQAKFKEKLAISIIKHNYPFTYVEHEGTRDLHKFLHPDANPICRNTAKKEVLRIYEREKVKVKKELEKIKGRICLTSDLWTSITSDGYMTLTAHYIDESWVLKKKVLNFRVIPPPHTGSLLAECVITFLREWGIENKVFTITLDNATNNNGLVDCLKDQLSYDALVCNGEFIHVRCCAHVLNLIVQSGLKVIEESIEKVRESVKFVRGSAARKIKFAECIARLKLQYRKNVRQDVVTRWNYTYLMLDCALMYRPAYVLLAKLDKTFKTCPTEEEWTRIEAIAMFLKPFYDITKLFSGTLYSTSNLYFHNVYKIQKSIQRHMLNPDPVVSGMAKDMKTKFDKYWETYTMVLSFGAILDPRYKLNIVEFYLSELGMEGPLLIEKGSTKGPSSNVGGGKLCDDAEDDLAGFETFQSQYKIPEVQKSQLDQYLDEPKLDKNQKIDILQFWKENQVRYPELAIMARDILSIPITTVASESTFSIGGWIISKYRSSLCSSNAKALLCTRDWLFDPKDEDEVDEKELIDEDIAKLVRSSSKVIIGGGGSSI
ncbi:zinc finger BED domain-containing protein RICESLEEPER 2-like protein [Tanacetum coccineum]